MTTYDVECEFKDPHPHSYMPSFCDIGVKHGKSHPYCDCKDYRQCVIRKRELI